MDDEDFLAAVEADNAGITPVAEEPVAEAPPEPAPEVKAEPEKAEPEVLELTELAPEQTKPTEGFVPIGAVLDERDKRKAAEARLAQLEQQRQQPVQTPDPYEDPEGYASAQEAKVQGAIYQANLRWSERIATIQHGEDLVGKAKAWAIAKCDADPYFNAKAASSEDPVGFAVTEYKREEIASKVDMSEYEQFQAWKAAQGQLQQPGGQPPPPPTASKIPTPSLAAAPSAGSILTEPVQSDDEIFDEVIGKR